MKSILKGIFGFIAIIAMVLATAEAETAGVQLLWSFGCMGTALVAIRILDKMGTFKEEAE